MSVMLIRAMSMDSEVMQIGVMMFEWLVAVGSRCLMFVSTPTFSFAFNETQSVRKGLLVFMGVVIGMFEMMVSVMKRTAR